MPSGASELPIISARRLSSPALPCQPRALTDALSARLARLEEENAALRAALTPPAVLLDVDKALEADKLYVERQLAEADDNPWGTMRLMWQSRLAAIAQEITAAARSGLDIPRATLTEGGVA